MTARLGYKSRSLSVFDRLERARERTTENREEILAVAALLSRMYPAHTCRAKRPNKRKSYDLVVCVHAPTGILAWKLNPEEEHRFTNLPEHGSACPIVTRQQRIDRIDALHATA